MFDLSKLYLVIGMHFPDAMRQKIESKLSFSGTEENSINWLGARAVLIFLFSIVGTLAYMMFQRNSASYVLAVFFIILSLLLGFLSYLFLYYAAAKRASEVEKNLPDFLMLIVSNLHAGMTPFSAFVHAARPEFGPLYYEIIASAARVGGKRTLDNAMVHLASRFDSEVFRKSIDLFLKGTKSGGQLAKLLTANSEEIRKIQDLRAELIASTRSYAIFLAFIVAIVMPFLLGISFNFLATFVSIESKAGISGSSQAAVPINFFSGGISITTDEMLFISIVALLMSSILTSMFMGIVISGKSFLGLKYFPFLLAAGILFFLVTKQLLQAVIGVK